MLPRVDALIERYKQVVSLPWERHLAGPQRVWFVVYDKQDERKIRYGLAEFENATVLSGKKWVPLDLTDAFAAWMGSQRLREAYFRDPDQVDRVLAEFRAHVIGLIGQKLAGSDADTVVALQGVACLFGLTKVSEVVHGVAEGIPGRLLVFFPGEHEADNYRLLDARDGWNYLAVPISAYGTGAQR